MSAQDKPFESKISEIDGFWMSTIWITGGKGFIGRHVAKYAAEQGHRVFGVGHGLWPAEEAARWSYSRWCNGEIEAANLSQLAAESGLPETIYHLAGGSAVGVSFQNPQEDFSRTVETTARLLEWVRLNSTKSKLVSVSSAAVYGQGHIGKIGEDALVTACSPYGFHKTMMESLCRSYGENFGLQIGMVRLFSVYGAGLEKQLIWDVCCKLSVCAGDTIAMDGTGNELRDWFHISDATRLLWLVRNRCSPACDVTNGGTGIGTRTAEVVSLVRRAWGASNKCVFTGSTRKGDPASLIADTTRAGTLGFRPMVKLEDGISETVDWFKKYRRGERLGA